MPSHHHLDLAVVIGTLSSDPVRTELASGSVLHRLQITVRLDDRTESVPVALLDPPRAPAVVTGDDVVVVGAVRRRFYRAGGRTASATEIVATSAAKATAASVRRATKTAHAQLAAALAP